MCAVIQCGGRECVSDAEWRGKVWAVKQCGWRLHTCTRTQIQKHVASYKLMLRIKLGSTDSNRYILSMQTVSAQLQGTLTIVASNSIFSYSHCLQFARLLADRQWEISLFCPASQGSECAESC